MKKFWQENRWFIITVIILFVIFKVKLPYYVNTPGGTININNRISYEGKKEYKGSLNMLYVTEYVATIPTYLLSYIIKDWDLEDLQESQVSTESPEEIDYRNKIMLENSINTAKYIAYKEANKKIEVSNSKIVVIGTTLKNSLKIGDEILEVEESKVTNLDDIKKIIENHEIGEQLSFKINRKNKERVINVEIKEVEGTKVLGVILVKNDEYETEPEIELKFKRSESGASGGLMMTLSIYQALTDYDLVQGRKIAGTGTIEMDGSVGEISGIKYKIIGAYRDGMDIVLVPTGNYKEASKVVKEKGYNMKIVEIKTFQDAIRYLKETSKK